jgi:hypothetical protein
MKFFRPQSKQGHDLIWSAVIVLAAGVGGGVFGFKSAAGLLTHSAESPETIHWRFGQSPSPTFTPKPVAHLEHGHHHSCKMSSGRWIACFAALCGRNLEAALHLFVDAYALGLGRQLNRIWVPDYDGDGEGSSLEIISQNSQPASSVFL